MDHKERASYLDNTVPFGFIISESEELKPKGRAQATINEIRTMPTDGICLVRF